MENVMFLRTRKLLVKKLASDVRQKFTQGVPAAECSILAFA